MTDTEKTELESLRAEVAELRAQVLVLQASLPVIRYWPAVAPGAADPLPYYQHFDVTTCQPWQTIGAPHMLPAAGCAGGWQGQIYTVPPR